MKKTRILAFILFIALIAASAMLCSCEKDEGEVLGSGKTSFKLEITNKAGDTKTYTIKTDEKTLEDALLKVELTKDTGLITTLDGITVDQDTDESWWKFLVNGEESYLGVAEVEIEKNAVYSFEYTIGFDMSGWDDVADDHDHSDPDHTH